MPQASPGILQQFPDPRVHQWPPVDVGKKQDQQEGQYWVMIFFNYIYPTFFNFFSACQSHQRTFDHFGGAYCVQFLGQREPFSWWSPGRLKSVFCFLCLKSPYVNPAKTRHRLSPRAILTSFSDGWVYLSWLVILQPAKMLRLWRGQSPWYFGNHDPTIQTQSQQKLEPWGHGKNMLFHFQTLTWML